MVIAFLMFLLSSLAYQPNKVGCWCNFWGKVSLMIANLGGYASGKERITKICFWTFCHGIPQTLLTSTVKKKGPRANSRHSHSAFVSFIQKPPVRLKRTEIFQGFSGKVCILEKMLFWKYCLWTNSDLIFFHEWQKYEGGLDWDLFFDLSFILFLSPIIREF